METLLAIFAMLDPVVRIFCMAMGFWAAIASLNDGSPYDRRAYLMAAAAFLMVLAHA